MGFIAKIFFIIVLGCLLFWLAGKLISGCVDFYYICRAQKHPEKFPRTDGLVYNRKTKKLEADSRPLLPGEDTPGSWHC